MKKYALSLLTLTMALSSGAVFAAGVGDIKTADVAITFASPSTISHSITAQGVMEAGQVPMNTLLANGVVTTGDDVDKIKVTFVNGESRPGGGNNVSRTITGVGGEKIVVSLYAGEGVTSTQVYGNESLIFGYNAPSKSFSYSLQMGSNQGTHTVEPDTYTIQVSAQRWEA
ncbi:hypothetical protein [Yersinia ruckeri]|uniref:hypothetical protein n=1 Tax=Yersinia ruckeri TaxID=29486 RepID=UPI0008FE8889|nr:hypothetical protein [Yersinia ruckeri]MCW6541528.1 hypothetical protein [Yersinia ruckeri]MCW6589910.1 hypothetical protein [Yersinia ruckeri]MCW6622711.1 hypothetical protein [Yersinia ruckeri]OJB96547.1 hypothetical protein AXW58_08780 [Yersinia ruckeri]OJB99592.1 hypothetical protein AXW57_08800 [Yersinia ruckeri]